MKKNLSLFFFLLCLLGVNESDAQTKELSLQQVLQEASKNNRQIQLRWLETRKAAEAVKEARSWLTPAVSGNASYNLFTERPVIYLRNENNTPELSDVKFGGRYGFDGNLTASYPVLHPVLKSNIRLAVINETVRKTEATDTEEQLALSISQLYLTMLMKQEQMKLLLQSQQRNEKALKDSRSLFSQGKHLKTDTLTNFIAVQNLRASASALENNIRILSSQLKQLLGMEDSITLALTDSLVLNNHAELLQNHPDDSAAIGNRQDIKLQSLFIRRMKEQVQNEKAAFTPQLWAMAQYQVQMQSDKIQFNNNSLPRTSWIGVRLNIPLYAGNRLKYKTTQANIAVKQAEIILTELKRTVQTELNSVSANIKEAMNQWLIQKQNVEAAQTTYHMMQERYRNGLGSRLELTDAELALTKTKMEELQTIYTIRLLEIELKKATGMLQLN